MQRSAIRSHTHAFLKHDKAGDMTVGDVRKLLDTGSAKDVTSSITARQHFPREDR